MTTSCKIPLEIRQYISIVRSNEYPSCREQFQLCDFVENVFRTEDIYVDEEQLAAYLSYQKYFPFGLFPWEIFCFALHNCTYRADGTLRFPILVIYVGRGAGKNGYLGFEDFSLLTKVNGIPEYHIDIFATSEDQAKQSFTDVWNMLNANEAKMKKHFRWTKELIVCTDTGSEFRFRTSNAKTKDGGRPGKTDFDEYHAYENYKLITVATTGLGKKKHPRQTITTTDGDVRGGPLDDLIANCIAILNGEVSDNGTLPFICRLDADEEVDNKFMWHKANPSLRYLPHLMQQLRLEYAQYKLNPASNTAFMTKRMNRPARITENAVAAWEDILATNQPIPESSLIGRPCVGGIDYAKAEDFVGAGLLWRVDGKDVWHSQHCKTVALVTVNRACCATVFKLVDRVDRGKLHRLIAGIDVVAFRVSRLIRGIGEFPLELPDVSVGAVSQLQTVPQRIILLLVVIAAVDICAGRLVDVRTGDLGEGGQHQCRNDQRDRIRTDTVNGILRLVIVKQYLAGLLCALGDLRHFAKIDDCSGGIRTAACPVVIGCDLCNTEMITAAELCYFSHNLFLQFVVFYSIHREHRPRVIRRIRRQIVGSAVWCKSVCFQKLTRLLRQRVDLYRVGAVEIYPVTPHAPVDAVVIRHIFRCGEVPERKERLRVILRRRKGALQKYRKAERFQE